MKDFMAEFGVLASYPANIVLLLARLAVAYGFTMPAMMKIEQIEATQMWFESIGIPFASLMAPLVSGIELAGIVLLTLGLFTRFISLLLMCVMAGAIAFVHFQHGFATAQNGFEIPLYYFLFLFIFATFGPGKYSIDCLIIKEECHA